MSFYVCLSVQSSLFFILLVYYLNVIFLCSLYYKHISSNTDQINVCSAHVLQSIVSPRIVPFSFEEPIFAGQAAQVTCLVSEGDAPIHFSWQLSGDDIPEGIGIEIQSLGRRGSNLMIEFAEARHGGNYTCSVRNTAGTVQYTTLLNVHGNCPPVHVR